MRDAETQGLVLYSRNYKEKDKLVKIFTESFGKRMFFVKNFGKSPYASSLQAFTDGKLTATINDGGFSFIEDVSEVVVYKNISSDIFINAHAVIDPACDPGYQPGRLFIQIQAKGIPDG